MPYFLKIISVFLLATVKFFYTPLYAYLTGLSLTTAIITINLGGITSFLFFYYISHFIIISTKYVKPVAVKVTPNPWLEKIRMRRKRRTESKKPRKRFTRRNRFIVRLRKAGVWAVIITTPSLLSIPVGAFLIRKYYRRNKFAVVLTLAAIVGEGILFCLIVWNSPGLQP